MAKRKAASLYRKDQLQNTRIVIYAMLGFMTLLALLIMISLTSIQKEQALTTEVSAKPKLDCATAANPNFTGPSGYFRFVTVTCNKNGKVFVRSYSARDCRSSDSYMSEEMAYQCADGICRLKGMCYDKAVDNQPVPTGVTSVPSTKPNCGTSCITYGSGDETSCVGGTTCIPTSRNCSIGQPCRGKCGGSMCPGNSATQKCSPGVGKYCNKKIRCVDRGERCNSNNCCVSN